MAEQAFDNSGHLVKGRRDQPLYHFRKTSRDPEESDTAGSNN